MAGLVGIDIRATHVRAVLLRTSYRKVAIEQMLEVELAAVGSLEQAIQACVLPMAQHSEALAVSIDGDVSFIHRLRLPATAQKQLAEVLPFEIEAQIPVDFDELVYDYRRIHAEPGQVLVLAAASRTEQVRERIQLLSRVLGREPERVGCGPLPLANLAALSPELDVPQALALVDLGGARTEVAILSRGEAVFGRTLSRGVQGLPESAPKLAAELRQTFAAFVAQGGEPVQAVYLLGGGSSSPGAIEYLAYELGKSVSMLPALGFEGLLPEQAALLPRYAKAISLALSLNARPRDLDLRRGPLAYQRGFGFLKEKVPVLSGLMAAILISFMFSTWAELRALSRQKETLEKALSSVSRDVLGKPATNADEAMDLLAKSKSKEDADPMPQMDAFDVIVAISKAIPLSVTHDIEEFDMQRGHVKINGVVATTADAQFVSGAVKKHRCFNDVKVTKITQVVNSERQKYVLEFDVKCPEEADPAKKKKKKPSAAAEDSQ